MSALTFGFTAKQIIKEGRITEDDISLLKGWLDTQSFPKLTDEQIVLFLLSCYNEQEPTKATIKAFYCARHGAPEIFCNRRMEREEVHKQLQTVEYCVFPERTDDGCTVIFHRLYDTSYWRYEMQTAMQLLFMTLDAAVYDHPPKGLVILFDMRGVGLMHLTRVKLSLIKTFFMYLQEGLPVRLKRIHVLNSVYFLDKVMSIIKPFIKKEVMGMLHFHPTNMDMEMFYEKWLPKRCLPEELGGDLPSVRVLHEENTHKLMGMQPHFEAEERQRLSIS